MSYKLNVLWTKCQTESSYDQNVPRKKVLQDKHLTEQIVPRTKRLMYPWNISNKKLFYSLEPVIWLITSPPYDIVRKLPSEFFAVLNLRKLLYDTVSSCMGPVTSQPWALYCTVHCLLNASIFQPTPVTIHKYESHHAWGLIHENCKILLFCYKWRFVLGVSP